MQTVEKFNCYYMPSEGERESAFRCTPKQVFVVSDEALAFKRKHWIEIPGVADGYCIVDGQGDWEEIYQWLTVNLLPSYYFGKDISVHGPSYLISVETTSGKLAHVGSITRINKELHLQG